MKKFRQFLSDNQLLCIFFAFFGVNLIITCIYAAATDGELLSRLLFMPHNGVKDHFMDFFNSIRDAGDSDVYEKGIIYPPLANLIFRFFASFIPTELVETDFASRMSIRDNQTAAVCFVLFIIICMMSMFAVFRRSFENTEYKSIAGVIAFALCCSYPAVFCIERGNILLAAFVATAAFVFGYESKSPIIREISYIALAFAAAIKIYPAVYGVLLLSNKKYKPAIRTALYGVILFFVPFFFYDGFASMKQLFDNLTSFSDGKSFTMGAVSISNFFYVTGYSGTMLEKITFVLTEILALGSAFVLPKKWQKCFMLSYVMLNISSASSYYALMFTLISFSLFLVAERKERSGINYLYLGIFSVFCVPLPSYGQILGGFAEKIRDYFDIAERFSDQTNLLIAQPLFQLMFVMLLTEAVYCVVARRRGKK